MNSFVSGLFVICVLISSTNPSLSEEEENGSVIDLHAPVTLAKDTEQVLPLRALENNKQEATDRDRDDSDGRRSLSDNEEKNSKPLRSIFMGIYKNYKSTYLGNKTLTEYKQTLRETMKNKQQKLKQNESIRGEEEEADDEEDNDAEELLQMEADDDGEDDDDEDEAVVTDQSTDESFELPATTTTVPEREVPTKLPGTRKRKHSPALPKAESHSKSPSTAQPSPVEHYNVGHNFNMSLDLNNSIVKVNLDGETLKELVTGRWLNDNSEEGRGKKYEMVTRILPLFILPFLIQSAIVPFLVTKLKLLLMKSMLVGKLAIFLLIISAFRNSNKMMQTYEVAPSYWASEPSRRSEMAAAASSMAYNGYRVEGKPTAWVN